VCVCVCVGVWVCGYVCSGDLTEGSPSTSVTVHTQHVHVRFDLNKRSWYTTHQSCGSFQVRHWHEVMIQKGNSRNGILVLSCTDPLYASVRKELYSDVFKTTNCSRTPLIAKRYLGSPLTNSLKTKWSMGDGRVSLVCVRCHWQLPLASCECVCV